MKNIRIPQVLAVALCAAAALPTFAADGDLDTGFGTAGKAVTDIGTYIDAARDLAIQADGKIVVVGESGTASFLNFGVVRYNGNGTLDPTFSSDGKTSLGVGLYDDECAAVAIQPDGKIVIAGYAKDASYRNFAVIRLNADSSWDSSFTPDGAVETSVRPSANDAARDMLLQSDGKIVVVGDSADGSDIRIAVVRYNPDGSLDSSFGSGGITNTLVGAEASYGLAAAIQADGKIVVAGWDETAGVRDFAVVRYNADGSLDSSFDTDGMTTTAIGSGYDYANAVAIQPDGKILAAGFTDNGGNYDFALVRYEAGGSLDTGFGNGGKVTYAAGSGTDYADEIIVQPDGRILVIGYSSNGTDHDAAVARFLPDGSIDLSFGTDGVITLDVGSDDRGQAAAVQLDGRLVVAGVTGIDDGRDFLCFRLNAFETMLFEDFESDYGNGDSITNYHGWQGDGLAVATSSAAHSGTLGGYVPWGSAVSNDHSVAETNQVWTDLYVQPFLREAADAPSVESGETAVFYFDTNGYAVVYHGESNDWLTVTNDAADNAVTPLSTGEWARVSVLQNYQSKKWALMLDDRVHAQQLGFADESVTESSAFATESTRMFDDLSIARDYPRSLSGDATDGDGLRDVWELHFMDTIAYGPLDDFDNDGAPNIVEMRAGTDPSDPSSRPAHPGTIFRLR